MDVLCIDEICSVLRSNKWIHLLFDLVIIKSSKDSWIHFTTKIMIGYCLILVCFDA
jgi:hypothetical protein